MAFSSREAADPLVGDRLWEASRWGYGLVAHGVVEIGLKIQGRGVKD